MIMEVKHSKPLVTNPESIPGCAQGRPISHRPRSRFGAQEANRSGALETA